MHLLFVICDFCPPSGLYILLRCKSALIRPVGHIDRWRCYMSSFTPDSSAVTQGLYLSTTLPDSHVVYGRKPTPGMGDTSVDSERCLCLSTLMQRTPYLSISRSRSLSFFKRSSPMSLFTLPNRVGLAGERTWKRRSNLKRLMENLDQPSKDTT